MNAGIDGMNIINITRTAPPEMAILSIIVLSVMSGFIWGMLFALWKMDNLKIFS